jgi:hypothetical protein
MCVEGVCVEGGRVSTKQIVSLRLAFLNFLMFPFPLSNSVPPLSSPRASPK